VYVLPCKVPPAQRRGSHHHRHSSPQTPRGSPPRESLFSHLWASFS